MKNLIMTVNVLGACWAMAQPPGLAARRVAEMVTREKPGKIISVLDVRKEATDAFAQSALKVQQMTTVKTVYSHQPKMAKDCGLAVAQKALKENAQAGAVVLIIDAGEAPSLAVFPEDRMAVINAQRVQQGAADGKVAAARMEKEIFRAVAHIAGGTDEQANSAMKTVLAAQDLDALVATTFSPSIAMTIAQNVGKFNFSTVETVPYRVAVVRGWAPAPTNDAQRAIWEQVSKSKAKATVTGGGK